MQTEEPRLAAETRRKCNGNGNSLSRMPRILNGETARIRPTAGAFGTATANL